MRVARKERVQWLRNHIMARRSLSNKRPKILQNNQLVDHRLAGVYGLHHLPIDDLLNSTLQVLLWQAQQVVLNIW